MISLHATPNQKWIRPIWVLSAGLAMLALPGCQQNNTVAKPNTPEPKIQVNAVKVAVPKDPMTFEYSGVVTPKKSADLSFQLLGTVSKVMVEEGDSVKKGQTLAVIDKSRYRSAFAAADAMHRQATDAHERLQTVHQKGSLPDIKWQEVITRLQQAESARQIAKENLKQCVLKAPIDGVVNRERIEVGTNVTPNIGILELVQMDTVYVRVSVPENEISLVDAGTAARISVGAIGADSIPGTVERVGVSANPISKTYEVKIIIDNSGHRLKPGMAAVAHLDIERDIHDPVIPIRAVMQDALGKRYVYVVDNRSRAIRKEIQPGTFFRNSLQIKGGLKAGQRVVVDGQQKLRSGESVTVRTL